MSKTQLIPPTPTRDAYLADGDRPLIAANEDPFDLFARWLAEARATEPSDANAMTLATVDRDGFPDARIVLLKGLSDGRLSFYTNLGSAKAQQIAASGVAALVFHWKSLERQVRVRGRVSEVSTAESDAYFAERARESQIGAWASDQSRPLLQREALEARVALFEDLYRDDPAVPRPPYWGGYAVEPVQFEFWQSQAFRLHDRRVYSRSSVAEPWRQARLNP